MTEHESMREMLALAAAGALDAEEQRRLDQHARDCPVCRRELEAWSAYARGLRRLPQPAIPGQLAERTRARILQERAVAADRRWDDLMLAALALFAWTVGLSFWFLLRVFSSGALVIMGANLIRLGTWSAVSTVLVWLTAAAAALTLGKRRRELRRVL
jgi:hypothetical protein